MDLLLEEKGEMLCASTVITNLMKKHIKDGTSVREHEKKKKIRLIESLQRTVLPI